jgi:FtsP/CotA-like multicopper oxidase with cupredoxin domain
MPRPESRLITRRELIESSGAAALVGAWPARAQDLPPPDYRLDIAPVSWDFGPRHRLTTTAYNGQIPGPLLRMQEGRPVSIEISNRTDHPEIVHWHGLFLPADVDGAAEEGSPMIAPGSRTRIRFTPRPAGFRWYHTHTMAMGNLTRAQFTGLHGFLMIDARAQPGDYDSEFFLTLHDWGAQLLASDDGAMNPGYAFSTINGKMLGAGEPLRVRAGERILLHLLNSSPTEVHWICLAGHTLQVLALDGNPVPTPATVPMLRLAPAERACVRVEMNNPGVWVLGEVRRHVQAAGLGVLVEYADAHGAPRWVQPATLVWSYAQFAAPPLPRPRVPEPAAAGPPALPGPPIAVPMRIESRFRGHGAMEGWTINGRSFPDNGIGPLEPGRRYRLQFINDSLDDHPLHLHRHSFELRSLGIPLQAGVPDTASAAAPPDLQGIIKDVVLVDAQTRTEVEFTADNPGATLFHCHQQTHMDMGFMLLFSYA